MRIKRLAFALLFAVLLAACSEPNKPEQPIRLGVIVDSSGASASLGISGRNGVQLAIEQLQ
jgi:ABC-type branched-subunit amino acid transport system substrate-binding protein